MGPSHRQGPKTTDTGMSFASAMLLHACYHDLSLVSGMENIENERRKSPGNKD